MIGENMRKIWGNILFMLARILDGLFKGLIKLSEALVLLGNRLKRIIFSLITTCLFAGMFFPFIFIGLFSPLTASIILIIALILIIPFLGKKAISALKYYRYTTTEYLYDRADYYRLGKESKKTYAEYDRAYRQAEEEERRRREEAFYREQERRQREQAEHWRRIFEEAFRQGNYQGRGQTGGYQGGSYGGSQSSGYNPYQDFTSQYKKACDSLGLSYNTDIYEVKLQYRKLAKQYHPDLNPDNPQAAEKFKEITSAYEFLSEENIERYKNMHHA